MSSSHPQKRQPLKDTIPRRGKAIQELSNTSTEFDERQTNQTGTPSEPNKRNPSVTSRILPFCNVTHETTEEEVIQKDVRPNIKSADTSLCLFQNDKFTKKLLDLFRVDLSQLVFFKKGVQR